MDSKAFKQLIKNFYKKNKRIMPWRKTNDPYKILVSEIMLQQTQVPRVMIKYEEFLKTFPDFSSLASASLEEVLRVWQGMGYNRRAKYLKAIAEKVVNEFKGELPSDPEVLVTFPGIGKNTAGSIIAFAFNKPVIFIETNIRRVFIHHFFADPSTSLRSAQDDIKIDDREIIPLLQSSIDKKNPKEWYYSLMDYGTFLAKSIPNPNRKSKHYSVQSKFEGSNRQIRGKILKELLTGEKTKQELMQLLTDERLEIILMALTNEGMIKEEDGKYFIK